MLAQGERVQSGQRKQAEIVFANFFTASTAEHVARFETISTPRAFFGCATQVGRLFSSG
jgi:hypothetical protein